MNVKSEFFKITRIYPVHLTNRLSDRYIRRDMVFTQMGNKVFDNHNLLNILLKKINDWLKLEQGEFTYVLAGYIYYLKEDFLKAEKYFLKAAGENPQNLDNWLDLAFSLYHQGDKKNRLAKKILFNFDYCVNFFSSGNYKNISRKLLETALKKLD